MFKCFLILLVTCFFNALAHAHSATSTSLAQASFDEATQFEESLKLSIAATPTENSFSLRLSDLEPLNKIPTQVLRSIFRYWLTVEDDGKVGVKGCTGFFLKEDFPVIHTSRHCIENARTSYGKKIFLRIDLPHITSDKKVTYSKNTSVVAVTPLLVKDPKKDYVAFQPGVCRSILGVQTTGETFCDYVTTQQGLGLDRAQYGATINQPLHSLGFSAELNAGPSEEFAHTTWNHVDQDGYLVHTKGNAFSCLANESMRWLSDQKENLYFRKNNRGEMLSPVVPKDIDIDSLAKLSEANLKIAEVLAANHLDADSGCALFRIGGGMSGGPVLNSNWEVIGINTLRALNTEHASVFGRSVYLSISKDVVERL